MEFLQYDDCKGYRIVPFNLKVLAKFGLCSNCSQKFDECSLARARQMFATARMLGFSLKFSVRVVEADNFTLPQQKLMLETIFPVWENWETLGKHAHAVKMMNVSGKMHQMQAEIGERSVRSVTRVT